MTTTLTTVTLIDGTGTARSFYAMSDGVGFTLCSQPSVSGVPVSTPSPLPTLDAASVAALGATADAPWPGSGSGSVVATLKAIWTLLTGSLKTTVPSLTYSGVASLTAGTSSGVLVAGGTYTRALLLQTLPGSTANVWLRADNGVAAANTGILLKSGGGTVAFGASGFPLPSGNITAITDGVSNQTVLVAGG